MKGLSSIFAVVIMIATTLALISTFYIFIKSFTNPEPNICENLCKQEGYDGWKDIANNDGSFYEYYHYNGIAKSCVCLKLKNCANVDNQTFCKVKEEYVYNEVKENG